MQILLIRLEQARTRLERTLRAAGFLVSSVDSISEAEELRHLKPADLVIMETGRATSCASEIRGFCKVSTNTGLIIVSPCTASEVVAAHLNAGADDHLGQNVEREELVSRVIAVIRRRRGHASSEIVVGELSLNLEARTACAQGRDLRLTPSEYAIFPLLMLRFGEVVAEDALLDALEAHGREPSRASLQVTLHRLRKKLLSAGVERHGIRAHPGGGYALVERFAHCTVFGAEKSGPDKVGQRSRRFVQ